MLCDAFMQALQALRKLRDDNFVGEEARLCLDLPSMLRVAAPTCVWGSDCCWYSLRDHARRRWKHWGSYAQMRWRR